MEPTPAGHLRLLAAERARGQPFARAWRRSYALVHWNELLAAFVQRGGDYGRSEAAPITRMGS